MLAAFALRLQGIEAQSLWYDEGTSIALAVRSPVQIARDASNDIHPPLYYWLLAGWVRRVGDGATAARALSVLIGTVTVALVLALGRRLFGRGAGLAAGALAAVSPYLVWYSQELRMYMLAAAWACALVYVALRLGTPGVSVAARRRWAVAATLLSLAALYTHYLGGAGALAVAGAAVALSALRLGQVDQRRAAELLGTWGLTQILAVAAFLPWLAYAWHTLRDWSAIRAPVGAAFLAGEAARVLSVGATAPPVAGVWWPAAVVGALVAIALGLARPAWRFGTAVGVSWLVLPVGLVGLVSLAKPAWNAKQIIVAAPAWELLLGLAVSGVACLAGRRPAARLGVALGLVFVLLVPRAVALSAMWFDPAYQRDDYRGIVRTIDRLAGGDDAVILNAPTQVELFDYYDRGRHATYPLPLQRPPDRAATLHRLAELATRHRDLYVVLWATNEADPEGLVEGWLNAERHKVSDEWHGHVRLATWAAPRPMVPFSLPTPARFGDAIALAGLERPPDRVAAGDIVTLVATWTALRVPPADYVVFTQLLDEAGHLVAQRDMAPLGGSARTSAWTAGARVEDRIGLRIPADLPEGRYRLILGLYDPVTGTRLPVLRRDGGPASQFDAGEVTVTPHRP